MDCDEVRVQISDLVDDDQEFQQAFRIRGVPKRRAIRF